MYPVILRIGSFELTSFGLMVALGAAAGLLLFHKEAQRAGLSTAAGDVGVWAVLGGLLGAKLLFVAEHRGTSSFGALLLDRGGLSWFGGLTGGLIAGVLALRIRRLPFLATFAAATPGLAGGQAIGRIGCFLVGDDYGRPSSLPWAVAFPRGLPPTLARVHPTQLYEALFLGVITVVLLRARRSGTRPPRIAGLYLVSVGAFRFALEFVRINPAVALGLTTAQWFSAAAAVTGLVLLGRAGDAPLGRKAAA